MATWTPLRTMLAGVETSATLSWEDLNELVGGLPPSASKHAAFWSGERSSWPGFRAHAQVGTSVTFRRVAQHEGARTPEGPFVPEQTMASSGFQQNPRARPEADASTDLILVSCGKSKSSQPAPARELYTSTRFREAKDYAERAQIPWFILSAKHGLVGPDDIVAPYDVALNQQPTAYRQRWGVTVIDALVRRFGPLDGMRIEVHAGAVYTIPIRDLLASRGATVIEPLAGLQQGFRIRWYRGSSFPPADRPLSAQTVEVPHDADLSALLDALTRQSNRRDLSHLQQNRDRTLDAPGLYSCWVDDDGAATLSRGLSHQVLSGLIYAGQAGASSSRIQKVSANTLWKRITRMHLGGNHTSSTLRLTLGSLLSEADGRLGVDETALTQWMLRHLQVVAVPLTDAMTLHALEDAVLTRLSPSLNLKGLERSPMRTRLKEVRKKHRGITIQPGSGAPARWQTGPTGSGGSASQEVQMPVVRVTWFEGKDAAKAAVAAEITESIVKHAGNSPESIHVIFEDVKPTDWANAGTLYGQPKGDRAGQD